MKCQAEIQILADSKLLEAECLLESGFPDGAFYLAGYVIELLLKARVCKTLGIDDFFVFDKPIKKDLYRPFKVHNFEELFVLSGIYAQFTEAKKEDATFVTAWSTVSPWNEEARYLTGRRPLDVLNFVISVREIATWIKKHL